MIQREKRVSTTSDCGLPSWLTLMTSAHLFIVPAAGDTQAHTHSNTHSYSVTESQA